MKFNFKKKQFLLLLMLSIIFTNCQKDDFHDHDTKSQKHELELVSKGFNDFDDLPGLVAKTVPQASGRLAARGGEIDLYDFKIDSTSVLRATSPKGTFYTMYITRSIDYQYDMFENLVICNRDTLTEAYIVTYYPHPEYYDRLKANIHAPYLGGVTVTRLDYDNLLKRDIITNCVNVAIAYCGNGKPGTLAGPGCYENHDGGAHVYTTTFTFCKLVSSPFFIPSGPLPESFVNINPGISGGGGEAGTVTVTPGNTTYPNGPGDGGFTEPIQEEEPGIGDPDGNPFVITRPVLPDDSHRIFVRSLSPEQRLFWNNPANAEVVEAIKDFLEEHSSTDDMEFAKNIVDIAHGYPDMALSLINFAAQNPDNIAIAQQMLDYIGNDYIEERIEISQSVINALNEYFNLYETTDEELIYDFIESIINPLHIEEENELVLPPSCESFNFVNTTSNWQESAVSNIHFNVNILMPQGVYSYTVNYPQPVLFGCPRNLYIGNTNITSGIAATLSAKALKFAMNETVKKYGNKPVGFAMIRAYFESRLKYNYPLFIPGGRVNFNSNNINVIPTQYQTNAMGTGNCD